MRMTPFPESVVTRYGCDPEPRTMYEWCVWHDRQTLDTHARSRYTRPMSTKETPIMLRANISAEEWAALRKLAIDQGMSNAGIVGAAIREYLEREGEKA